MCALRCPPEPGVQVPPPGHEQMACGFPRKARCPSGLAAVIALRAGRDDPRVHPQDVCDCPRAAARRSLNTPPASAPGSPPDPVPRRTQFLAVPDARAEPDPITEPEWPAKPEFARQARAELRRPPHRQWPAHRAATEHVTASLSGVRSGDEDDPVPGSLLGRAGRTARQPGRMAAPGRAAGGAPRDLTGRIARLTALSP